jgi:sigma54-dependent transcription regulator
MNTGFLLSAAGAKTCWTMLTESNIYADALLESTPPRQQEVTISPTYLCDYLIILIYCQHSRTAAIIN